MIYRPKTDLDRKSVKTTVHRFLILLILFWCTSSTLCGADDVTENASATDSYCAECHEKEFSAISTEGLAHKTDVGCTDCHQGHKPKSLENIPACSQCHEGTAHFDLQQCLNCHRNPHSPMNIKLPKKAHAECLTCHDSQGLDLEQHQSYHSLLVCTDCHYDHGFMPKCTSCHKSHGLQMSESNCQTCHSPHKPLEMVFVSKHIPTDFCSPCHDQAASLLEKSTKKHHDLSCVDCHEQHASIPDCRSCHDEPHADAMHKKFPLCGTCHGVAHSLE